MASMKGKIDLNGLKKFQQGLSKMNAVQRQKWTEAAVKELSQRLLAKVIKRTPVGQYGAGSGKTGGTLRRGWTVGAIRKKGDLYEIDIINLTEYAPYVEFGHRTPSHTGWVDGQFMLTISEQELRRDAAKILTSKLKTFMGGVFK